MNTITLPDNISFEELAQKWCEWREGGVRLINFKKNADGIRAVFVLYDELNESREDIACFFFYEKKFKIINGDYEDDVEFILDFIKGRSNG